MSILKIDDQNEIYYEFIEPKGDGCTFVFVNALTGSTVAWNGIIGDRITEDGNGFLAYNFRGQDNSKFSNELNLDTDLIVSDLCLLIENLKLKFLNKIKKLIEN